MITSNSYSKNALEIVKEEGAKTISLTFRGKSNDRDPSAFLAPILDEVVRQSRAGEKEIVLDFQALEYMNSSTITPIIKILDQIKGGSERVSILYNQAVKWQHLSFTALKIFETQDERIRIVGEV